MGEIEIAVTRQDVGFIDFEDENLALNRGWFLDLLQQFTARFGGAGIELRAMNGLFPPSLDEELICAMKAAGFQTLNLSLGSSSPEQLERFGRPDVRSALSRVLVHAKNHELQAVVYVIAAGPGQKAEDTVRDLFFLARQQVLAGLSIFYPAPGSADHGLCESLGILPEALSLWRSSALPVSRWTTRREAVTLLRLARILNFIKLLGPPGVAPAPFSGALPSALRDRKAVGMDLLGWFLHDGRIRGVTPEGEIYQHQIAPRLTAQFIQGLLEP